MKPLLFVLAAILLAGSASAESINVTVMGGFLGTACYQNTTQDNSRSPLGFVINITELPGDCGLQGPSLQIQTLFTPFVGHATFVMGCFAGPDLPAFCSASMLLDGDFYFGGSGIASFGLGAFFDGCCGDDTLRFSVDGQAEIISGAGGAAMVNNLQLGEYHHITLQVFAGGQDVESFSYDLRTPGILGDDVNPPPVPEPSAFLLCAGGLLVVGLKRRF